MYGKKEERKKTNCVEGGGGGGGREMRKGNLAHGLKANPISSLDCHVRPTCTRWIASENGSVLRYISRCSAPTNSTVLEL